MPGFVVVELGCSTELDAGEEGEGDGVKEETDMSLGVEDEGGGGGEGDGENGAEVIGADDEMTIEEDIENENVADEAIVDDDNGEVGAGVSETEGSIVVTAGGVNREVSRRGLGSVDAATVSGNSVTDSTAVPKSTEGVTAGDVNNAL